MKPHIKGKYFKDTYDRNVVKWSPANFETVYTPSLRDAVNTFKEREKLNKKKLFEWEARLNEPLVVKYITINKHDY